MEMGNVMWYQGGGWGMLWVSGWVMGNVLGYQGGG